MLDSGTTTLSIAEHLRGRKGITVVTNSVSAIDTEGNMSVGNLASVPAKQAMIRVAKEVIVPADSSKLGRASIALIDNISKIGHLITDEGADPELVDAFRKKGVKVTCVPVPKATLKATSA